MKIDKESSTALSIACALALAGEDPRYSTLIDHHLKQASALAWQMTSPLSFRLLNSQARESWFQKIWNWTESLFVPGIIVHWILRKRVIRTLLIESMRAGNVEQVILFGGGFDPLLWSIAAKHPAIEFIETDHPATQHVKKQIYEKLGPKPANFNLISCDYTHEKIQDKLQHNIKFAPDKKTFFIAEGLMMYLSFEQCLEMLDFPKTLVTKDSDFLFTYLNKLPEKKGSIKGNLLKLWLNSQSEPFQWAMTKREIESRFAIENIPVQLHLETDDIFAMAHTTLDTNIQRSKLENLCVIGSSSVDTVIRDMSHQ